MSEPAEIPDHGRSPAELLAAIDAMAIGDIDWRGGRAFSLVYNVDDDEHEHLLAEVAGRFLHENALNPFKYPSLLQMELELVAMACGLFGTAPDAGALTSGGTESIFLAVQVARDHARTQRGIAEPRLVTPTTAHPAFAKAAKYLDVEHVLVPVAVDGRADVAATAEAIDDRTGLVVGSAPCYPYGVIDPIEELAAVAMDHGALFHTDACLGGWLLPWWERLGDPNANVVPLWDFRVPGVTSLSADVHKYGYSFKGSSIVAYRSRDLLRHQHFWYDDWPGGLYASGTSAGTRPAPPIAGAWAAVNHLGVDGYVRLTAVVRDTARRIRSGIAGIDGIAVSGDDALGLPIMEVRADRPDVDMAGVGDIMDRRGWNLDRQQGGLHLMLSPYHARIADQFLADLADAVADHTSSGSAARYGGIVGEGT